MIARTSLALALLFPAAIVPAVRALEAPPIVQDGPERGDEEEGNPVLHQFMENLGGTMRSLGRGLKEDGAMEKGLAEVLRLQRAVIEAKDQMPMAVSSIEDTKKRRASEIDYRTQMQGLANGLFALELAYLAEDAGKVEKQLKELDKVKRQGHSSFKPN